MCKKTRFLYSSVLLISIFPTLAIIISEQPDEVGVTKKPPVTTVKPDVTEKPEPVVEKEVSVTVVTKTKPTKPKAKISLQDLIEELEGQTDRPEREDVLVTQGLFKFLPKLVGIEILAHERKKLPYVQYKPFVY